MTTAAEALEKLIRLERDLEKKCHDLGYYNMIHVGLREFVEHAAAFRAALATPQAGEVEECIRLLQAYLPVRTLGEEAQHGGLPETLRMAIRLLRATQSNGHSPLPQGNQVQSSDAEVTPRRTETAAGESPAQSSAEEKWLDAACKELGYQSWWIHEPTNRLFVERPSSDPGMITVATPVLTITVSAAPAQEPSDFGPVDLTHEQMDKLAAPPQAAPAQPVAWRYLYHDPHGSDMRIWHNSSNWNGMTPIESQPLYSSPQHDEAVALLRALEPHLDKLICYASTTDEYEPNAIVERIRAYLARTGGKEET